MKKVFLVVAILFVVAAVFSSCQTSRKSGCPMTEKIIRG
jgi:predicted small secreted protein